MPVHSTSACRRAAQQLDHAFVDQQQLELPELAALGLSHLSASGYDLLLVHKGVIQLLRWHDGKPTVLWTANLPDGHAGVLPRCPIRSPRWSTRKAPSTSSRASDGKPRRRYAHGHQPAGAAAGIRTQMVVLDQDPS